MSNSTGRGLTVVISCQYLAHHHWMAFASWYSLGVNLPDAKVVLVCERGVTGEYFTWARRCKIPLVFLGGEGRLRGYKPSLPCLVIDPDILAVRELTPEILALQNNSQDIGGKVWFLKDSLDMPLQMEACLCTLPKIDNFATFVTYEEGWGKFVTNDCINRKDYPFRRAERFSSGDQMSLNELKIIDLWKRMDRIFTVIAR